MNCISLSKASLVLALTAMPGHAAIVIDPIDNDVSPPYNGVDDPWTIPGNLVVGGTFPNGKGQLEINAGSVVNNINGTIGFAPGSEGAVTVTGGGSQWNNSGFLTVGNAGSATLNVLDGAVVSQSNAIVGQRLGVLGDVTVSGAGSQWNASQDFFLGQSGGIANVHIQNGASMTGQRISVRDGSSLNLSGTGTTASSSVGLAVGSASGATLNIETGAALTTVGETAVVFGDATISGPGSQWILDGQSNNPLTNSPSQVDLKIGSAGNKLDPNAIAGDATLTIENGGKLIHASSVSTLTDTIDVGEITGSQGSIVITGAGSELSTIANMIVGEEGIGEMKIQNGGVATVDRSLNIAAFAGSAGSAVTVTGPASELNVGTTLVVGREDAGTLTITDGGLVKIDGTLVIDLDEDGDSAINMQTGGRLALLGDDDDTITEFLGRITGTDAINYWDGSTFADITNATRGIDYTLEFFTTGSLAGYTVLAVPEPSVAGVVIAAGLIGLRRRGG